MSRPISKLPVTEDQREELQRIISRPTSSQRLVRRCRIIVQRHGGASQQQVSQELKINRPVVSHWENRFRENGITGLRKTICHEKCTRRVIYGRGVKPIEEDKSIWMKVAICLIGITGGTQKMTVGVPMKPS